MEPEWHCRRRMIQCIGRSVHYKSCDICNKLEVKDYLEGLAISIECSEDQLHVLHITKVLQCHAMPILPG